MNASSVRNKSATRVVTCAECQISFERFAVGSARVIHCDHCRLTRFAVQQHAAKVLNQAIRDGKIKCAKGQSCVDCGKPALCLDHRNYLAPLEVEPVCRSCNFKRPPAIWKSPMTRPHKSPSSAKIPLRLSAPPSKLSDAAVSEGDDVHGRSPFMERRISRSYQRMLDATSIGWQHAWGAALVAYCRQRNAARTPLELRAIEAERGLC